MKVEELSRGGSSWERPEIPGSLDPHLVRQSLDRLLSLHLFFPFLISVEQWSLTTGDAFFHPSNA